MLELNDKGLEMVSGGSSWTTNLSIKANYMKITANHNLVIDGSQIVIAVTQFNGFNAAL